MKKSIIAILLIGLMGCKKQSQGEIIEHHTEPQKYGKVIFYSNIEYTYHQFNWGEGNYEVNPVTTKVDCENNNLCIVRMVKIGNYTVTVNRSTWQNSENKTYSIPFEAKENQCTLVDLDKF